MLTLRDPSLGAGDRRDMHKCVTIDSEKKIFLNVGLRGYITEVDEDGDINVFFPGLGDGLRNQWIDQDSFDALTAFVPL